MATQEQTFKEVLSLAKQLTPGQKLRLIGEIVLDLEEPLQRAEDGERPLRSLYGLWKDFGVSISAEEIDKARQEMGGRLFPARHMTPKELIYGNRQDSYKASVMRYCDSPPAMGRETCASSAPWLAAKPDPIAISTSW
jgi:hypothetical protein